MIAFLSYFIVPTAVFLAAVKLNNKRRWLTSRVRGYDYYWTKNGISVDKDTFWFLVVIFFAMWPILVPIIIVVTGLARLVRWITNGEGVVPIGDAPARDDKHNRYH